MLLDPGQCSSGTVRSKAHRGSVIPIALNSVTTVSGDSSLSGRQEWAGWRNDLSVHARWTMGISPSLWQSVITYPSLHAWVRRRICRCGQCASVPMLDSLTRQGSQLWTRLPLPSDTREMFLCVYRNKKVMEEFSQMFEVHFTNTHISLDASKEVPYSF